MVHTVKGFGIVNKAEVDVFLKLLFFFDDPMDEELDMEQQTGSKSGKAYIKAVYCHPAYLTYMQEKGTTEDEMAGWHH